MSEKRGESNEVVGRDPRARRFSDCSGNSPYNREQSLHRGTAPTTRQSLHLGTVPTTGNSLHRKHVMAVVGNGSQPFRRAEE